MASGRKREFDETTALKAAMEVFWRKGYVGASLSELTQNMGINKPSMYSAFGNKEALFLKATEYYIESKNKPHLDILFDPNLPFAERLKKYLMSIIAVQCESEQPKGCYLVLCQAEIASGDIPEAAEKLLTTASESLTTMLVDVFTKDPQAVELGLHHDAQNNALFMTAILKGSASLARTGTLVSELEGVLNKGLQAIGLTGLFTNYSE